MAVKLAYTAGDSNYLKVVLLDEVLHTPVHSYSKTEGKFTNLKSGYKNFLQVVSYSYPYPMAHISLLLMKYANTYALKPDKKLSIGKVQRGKPLLING